MKRGGIIAAMCGVVNVACVEVRARLNLPTSLRFAFLPSYQVQSLVHAIMIGGLLVGQRVDLADRPNQAPGQGRDHQHNRRAEEEPAIQEAE